MELRKSDQEDSSVDVPAVNMITFNQTQDYIAVATEKGIDLI